MRRVIRNINTRKYLKDGDWVADIEAAQHFDSVVKLSKYCAAQKLADVEMVISNEGKRADIVVPIPTPP